MLYRSYLRARVFVFLLLVVGSSRTTAQPLTVSLEVVPGTVVIGGARMDVEVFITNDGPDFVIGGYQIEVPCTLPGQPGSAGSVRAFPTQYFDDPDGAGDNVIGDYCRSNADCPGGTVVCVTGPDPNVCRSIVIGNTSSSASGSIPWVFAAVDPNGPSGCGGGGCHGGIKAAPGVGPNCRFAGIPGAGEKPSFYIVPGAGSPFGNRRYMGTISYEVSDGAAGAFNMNFMGHSLPCNNLNLTRVLDETGACVDFTAVPTSITTGCGPCRLHGDMRPPFCAIELADLLAMLEGYADADVCLNLPETDLAYADDCPVECLTDVDCTSGGTCAANGKCCAAVGLDDILAWLTAIERMSDCPHDCNPGACEFDSNGDSVPDCCKDREYYIGGMSESDCFTLGGTYLGDNVSCSLPYCSP